MANKTLFQTIRNKWLPKTDAVNEAGGIAYRMSAKQALAQYAATGCLNSTFYATAEQQLDKVLQLCREVEPEFIARTALYARSRSYMKDLPALLCAVLSVRDKVLLDRIFHRVIDNPKMLRNFVQIVRSGVVGRKSLGSAPKRLVGEWLEKVSFEQLFAGSVGQSPSLADIVKMVHPKPSDAAREALYGYLIGRNSKPESLPELVRDYEAYKSAADRSELPTPPVPFQMLTALPLTKKEWQAIARRAPWQMTRINLNTFQRHGVFEDPALVKIVAKRLRNPKLIRQARVFPYQLLIAFKSAQEVPPAIQDALQDAMEIALENIPAIEGKVYVFPDVSGSMQSAVTGYRRGSTSAVRCVDVAGLAAAALLRKNRKVEILPFDWNVVDLPLNARDSVMTNAEKLASVGGGGTNCSSPLRQLNQLSAKGDLAIYISDNQSWMDTPYSEKEATATLKQWALFKQRNPQAKMICIDVQPYGTVQAQEREDIFHVAGFSDEVFHVIAAVASGQAEAGYWARQIESMELDPK